MQPLVPSHFFSQNLEERCFPLHALQYIQNLCISTYKKMHSMSLTWPDGLCSKFMPDEKNHLQVPNELVHRSFEWHA